jgi:hypothetical protein
VALPVKARIGGEHREAAAEPSGGPEGHPFPDTFLSSRGVDPLDHGPISNLRKHEGAPPQFRMAPFFHSGTKVRNAQMDDAPGMKPFNHGRQPPFPSTGNSFPET